MLGDESSNAAKTFAQNIDGGVPFEASAFLDLSEAEGVEMEDGVVEWSGALIRGVAICPYGTDRNTVVSLKVGKKAEEAKETDTFSRLFEVQKKRISMFN